jgi:hypothetical protein
MTWRPCSAAAASVEGAPGGAVRHPRPFLSAEGAAMSCAVGLCVLVLACEAAPPPRAPLNSLEFLSTAPIGQKIHADMAKPEAELYEPRPDLVDPDLLLLQWKVSGQNLGPKPITLEWATRPEGTWTFIGEERLPNTGSYRWRLADYMPSKVYLRLSVRDLAGNVTVAQTPVPSTLFIGQPELREVVIVPLTPSR